MGETSHDGQPRLFMLEVNGDRGRQVQFSGTSLLVGREAGSDLLLRSPDVSRRHALLWRDGNHIFVEDLDSSVGTRVNGMPLAGPHALQVGDVIAFASTRLLVEAASGSPDPRAAEPPDRIDPAADAAVRFNVGDQRAHAIHMVGGNQYTTHVIEQRRNLLLDVAAAKTRARWIVWTGFLLMLVGFSFFAAGVIRFLMVVADAATTGEVPDTFTDPFGVAILGVPSGLVGWAVAGVGTVLMVLGGVLHLVAIGRQKRVDRELPLPPNY